MRDTVRRYVEAGRDTLTPRKAEELARSLVKEGQARREQVERVARDLADWSRRSSERLLEIIRSEVRKQISNAGFATKEEVQSLKRRVRSLETAQKASTTPATAKTSTAAKKSSGRKPSTARKRTTPPAGGTTSG